jgi:hypothetical protein
MTLNMTKICNIEKFRLRTNLVECLVVLNLIIVNLIAAPVVALGAEHPSKRIDYAIAYVPFLHSVVMFGGWAPPDWIPTNEASRWDGNGWSRWTAPGAPAFAHHTMAFDSKRNVLVVCGRPTPSAGGEYQVWEYGGDKWERRANIPVGASAQGDPKLTYDSGRNRLLLYVARNLGTAEVWEFDGKDWQLIKSPHQPVRCDDNGCLFQYSGSLKKAVLVGEERTTKEPLAWDGHEWGVAGGSGTQTWLWDGIDWARVPGDQPPRAVWGGITFDSARNQLVLLTTRMETWTLRNGKWLKLHRQRSPQPVPNGFFAIGYDPVRKTSLFFGGESRSSEPEKTWAYPEATWIYDGHHWVSR